MKYCLLLLLLSLAWSCGPDQQHSQSGSKLELLADHLTGSFHSARQAASDSNYYNISLEMARIWPERTDGFWIYVEQSVTNRKDKPYRQRIYHVKEEEDSTYRSVMYAFDSASRYAGWYTRPEAFHELSASQLQLLEGCDVILTANSAGTHFTGGTHENDCKNSWGKANYATSEVQLTDSTLISWDRGYDSTHTRVWGAEWGPYVFDKITDRPL